MIFHKDNHFKRNQAYSNEYESKQIQAMEQYNAGLESRQSFDVWWEDGWGNTTNSNSSSSVSHSRPREPREGRSKVPDSVRTNTCLNLHLRKVPQGTQKLLPKTFAYCKGESGLRKLIVRGQIIKSFSIMDEKNEAFQRKFGDKNCGMSSSKFSLIIRAERRPFAHNIFISNDKQALIYLSKGSSRGANMIWDNLPRSLTVMASHYLHLPPSSSSS